MVPKSVINNVKRYLRVLTRNGINAEKAVLYGSYARGEQRRYSDIDVLVLAKEFDNDRWSKNSQLWKLTLKADLRIQPIPVGLKQYETDDGSTIIEMARREGIEIKRN